MDNNEGFLEGNGIIILILFFLMFGMNGNGWGNNGNNIYDATSQQTMFGKLDGISNGLCSTGYENAQLINGLGSNINCGFDKITAQINELGYQMNQNCCDIKTQMLQDKYDALQQQLTQAQMAISNSVQTQNILGQLGRYTPYYMAGTTALLPGTTVS